MKTKPIPESWHQFHRLVIIHSHNPKWSLNRCVAEAGCSARMPRIYLALGWIIAKSVDNKWNTNVVVHLTPEMAEQIRQQSKRMETASDPLGLNKPLAKPTGPTLTSEELAAYRLTEDLEWNGWKMPTLEETKERIQEKRTEELKKFWDADLVTELRRRGYEVTAKKIVEL